MTKIRNTKKGMAKKTLSISLAVAMLATSNVPVWAAEDLFTDGSVVEFTAEAEAPVEVVEEAPVVEETVEAPIAQAATDPLYIKEAEFGSQVVLDGVCKMADGTAVTAYHYEWLIDGKEPAPGSTSPYEGDITFGHPQQIVFVPAIDHVGGMLSLKITGTGAFADYERETPAVKVEARDISKFVTAIGYSTPQVYDGTEKQLDSATIAIYEATGISLELTAKDFIYVPYSGDIVNATEEGQPAARIKATVNKKGYRGSKLFDMPIEQRTLANSNTDYPTDKTKNDILVSLKNKEFKYTGEAIVPTYNDFTVKNLLSGEDVNSKVLVGQITANSALTDVGNESSFTTKVDKQFDKNLNRNYASGAFASATFATSEKAKVVARDLSTCDINDISFDLDELVAYGSTGIKNAILSELEISEGTVDLNNATFKNNIDVDADFMSIYTAHAGDTFNVTVKTKNDTTNVVGTKVIKLNVVQNDINDVVLTTTGFQDSTGGFYGGTMTLGTTSKFAEEFFTGNAITKTADQLGTIKTGQGERLLEGTDYTVVCTNNTDVGTAKVYLKGIGSFGGQKLIGTFEIKAPVIYDGTAKKDYVVVPETVAYDGSKTEAKEYLKKSDIKVQALGHTWTKKDGSFVKNETLIDVPAELYDTKFGVENNATTIVDGTKLTTTIKTNKDVDKTSKAYKNYGLSVIDSEVTVEDKTTVRSLSVENADVTVVGAPFTYTGEEIIPELIVKDGERELVKDVDYTVDYTLNAKNAGIAKITIRGKGDYSTSKTKTVEFTINKANIADVIIAPSKAAGVIENNFTYTGNKLVPTADKYDIKLGTVVLDDEYEGFKVTYPASSKVNINAGKEAGSGTLTVKADATNQNFTGSKEFKFDIERKVLETTAGIFTVWEDGKVIKDSSHLVGDTIGNLGACLFDYDGTAHTFDKVTYAPATDLNVKEGVDYEIKYYNNVRGKFAAVYVNALGNYKNPDVKFADDKTTYADAKFFAIAPSVIKSANVTVNDTAYAGGVSVKPTVKITVNGKTLVEDVDFEIKTTGDCVNVTPTDKVLTAKIVAKDGYELAPGFDGTIKWKVVKKDLADCEVIVSGTDAAPVVVVKNGSVIVDAENYTLDIKDGKVTVTATKDNKNYTGSVVADIKEALVKPAKPVISGYTVEGNKVTVNLAGDAEGAIGYDFVIDTQKDCTDTHEYYQISKNNLKTSGTFTYVDQDIYYAYCHAYTRDENGKKVFSDWSEPMIISVSAITPETPTITGFKVKGDTVTVTYTACKDATGYDVVLGTEYATVAGEKRPMKYGELVKKNINGNTVTATFKNVPAGTYYAGLHAFNRTSEDGKKVFSPWSNIRTIRVK